MSRNRFSPRLGNAVHRRQGKLASCREKRPYCPWRSRLPECVTPDWCLICLSSAIAPHPEPSSLLPPHTIPLGRLSAPAPGIQYHASNLDWRLVSYMILYMFQCHSPKLSPPRPHSSTPAWRVPWTEEPGGLQSVGSLRVGHG